MVVRELLKPPAQYEADRLPDDDRLKGQQDPCMRARPIHDINHIGNPPRGRGDHRHTQRTRRCTKVTKVCTQSGVAFEPCRVV